VKVFFAAALLASTCLTPPKPGPVVTPEPEPTEEPAPTASDPCEEAWDVQAEAECPPAAGHDEWVRQCLKLPTSILDCVMRVDSCAYMRACLEQPQ
jgi:hypothetical protein